MFTSVAALAAASATYLAEHNKAPKPFVWTKSAAIIPKTRRAEIVLAAASAGNQALDLEQ